MRKHTKIGLASAFGLLVAGAPLAVWGSNVGSLTSFAPHTPIHSAEVNANFSAVSTAVNSKQDLVSGTCGGGSAIAGINADGTVSCSTTGLVFGATVQGSATSPGLSVSNADPGDNVAILGVHSSDGGSDGAGVEGDTWGNLHLSGSAGVRGVARNPAVSSSYGVVGLNLSAAGGTGVLGEADGAAGAGVVGVSGGYGVYGSANGTLPGVYGQSSAGPAVLGQAFSATQPGVEADGVYPGAIALRVTYGGIQVPGAGHDTNTPVFTHIATAASIAGDGTQINNVETDNHPDAILIVTQNFSPNSIYNAHPVGVYYSTGHWLIFNEDGTTMPTNAAFNVMVVHP